MSAAEASRRVLGHVLDQLLRLLHPVIPFVTEELWTALTGGETVHDRRLAGGRPVAGRRRRRGGARPRCSGWSPRSAGSVPTRGCARRSGSPPALDGLAGAGIAAHEPLIRSLVRLDPAGDDFHGQRRRWPCPAASVSRWTPGASIDVAAERARLTKDRAAAEKEAAQARAKLDNPAFVGKAPEPVVAKIRDRLATAEADLVRIDAALEALPS